MGEKDILRKKIAHQRVMETLRQKWKANQDWQKDTVQFVLVILIALDYMKQCVGMGKREIVVMLYAYMIDRDFNRADIYECVNSTVADKGRKNDTILALCAKGLLKKTQNYEKPVIVHGTGKVKHKIINQGSKFEITPLGRRMMENWVGGIFRVKDKARTAKMIRFFTELENFTGNIMDLEIPER
jgi:hypothetical protein